MIFKWFDASDAKRFGESLAAFYIQRIPPNTESTDQQFARKTADVLKKMELQLLQFKQSHQLNAYKSAQLGNAFKWALRDAGYDEAYTDRLTDWLVTKN